MSDDEEVSEAHAGGQEPGQGEAPSASGPRDGIAEQVGAKRPVAFSELYPRPDQGGPTELAQPAQPPRGPFVAAIVALVAIALAGSAIVALAVVPTVPGTLVSKPTVPPAGQASAAPLAASPTPTPSADPGSAIKAAFWTLVSAPDASYHLGAKGKSVFDGKTYETFTESVDIVGDDYSGTIRRTARGPLLNAIQPSRIASATIARKAGVVWLKEAGKHRTSRRSSARSDRKTPFLYIDLAAWIDYVKPVTVNGRHLHLLRTNKFYRPDIARLLDLARFNVVPNSMALDVYVTDQGVPVKADFSLSVTGSDQIGRRHTFKARTDFTISKFGAKLTIRVPKR